MSDLYVLMLLCTVCMHVRQFFTIASKWMQLLSRYLPVKSKPIRGKKKQYKAFDQNKQKMKKTCSLFHLFLSSGSQGSGGAYPCCQRVKSELFQFTLGDHTTLPLNLLKILWGLVAGVTFILMHFPCKISNKLWVMLLSLWKHVQVCP